MTARLPESEIPEFNSVDVAALQWAALPEPLHLQNFYQAYFYDRSFTSKHIGSLLARELIEENFAVTSLGSQVLEAAYSPYLIVEHEVESARPLPIYRTLQFVDNEAGRDGWVFEGANNVLKNYMSHRLGCSDSVVIKHLRSCDKRELIETQKWTGFDTVIANARLTAYGSKILKLVDEKYPLDVQGLLPIAAKVEKIEDSNGHIIPQYLTSDRLKDTYMDMTSEVNQLAELLGEAAADELHDPDSIPAEELAATVKSLGRRLLTLESKIDNRLVTA
ncbi:MAG: hypothetical protein ACR2FM_05140 [Candidatus Saccharimonadales bacterium]